MSVPLNRKVKVAQYDKDTFRFQLMEGNSPVDEDLSTQTIKFYIRNGDPGWQNIEKDVVSEGWILENTATSKVIKVIVDTEDYNMCQNYTTNHKDYHMRIEWFDKKLMLIDYELEIMPTQLWSVQ